jgi:hypothetical protein
MKGNIMPWMAIHILASIMDMKGKNIAARLSFK